MNEVREVVIELFGCLRGMTFRKYRSHKQSAALANGGRHRTALCAQVSDNECVVNTCDAGVLVMNGRNTVLHFLKPLPGTIGMVHDYWSINKTDLHLSSAACVLHKRSEPHKVQRLHKTPALRCLRCYEGSVPEVPLFCLGLRRRSK